MDNQEWFKPQDQLIGSSAGWEITKCLVCGGVHICVFFELEGFGVFCLNN